ncbi:Uncharacterized membrane protein [Frankia canadensis]|uniref:Uncharacterized membrane protein n=1 Tax=Frankia canadensis TaxID=1836972 RepID=A0A2I2KZT9_9ACTN|nr:anthrone oxygenase family protein [Frankia canadensis]SNQ51170.1 Uncharacterized membrane protein [Frankia canadensis]SOU58460.1 Uncharacterized membrane protein [Frankia canadensis]
MDMFHRFVTLPTAALSGITGGVLFGFSILVMPALRRAPAPSAIRSMQQINVVAPHSLLMLPLFGSALGCVGVGIWALGHWGRPGSQLLLLGAIAGAASLLVTAAINIPLNNGLADLNPDAVGAADTWLRYVSRWSVANHIRSLLAFVCTGALLAAARWPNLGVGR